MNFADSIESIVYKGEKNTPEGIRMAFKVGMISEETMNELLQKYHFILQEVAA